MIEDIPSKLVKYCSAEGGIALLDSASLRWSAPDLFGDPFELDKHSELRFDTDSLLEATVKLSLSLIFGREAPVGDTPLINAIRRWRETNRFSDATEAQSVLRELLGKMVKHKLEHLDELLSEWQTFSEQLRLCCFCTQPNLNAAWEKYADNYRGLAVVLRQGEKTGTQGIRPVVYQQERTEVTSLKEQLSTLVYNKPDKSVERFQEHFFFKSARQKAEQEWRAIRRLNDESSAGVCRSGEGFDEVSFPAEEVSAIYLGLNMDPKLRETVKSLVRSNYPETHLYQCTVSKNGYNIAFESLSNLQ